jgi:hypothetical protein
VHIDGKFDVAFRRQTPPVGRHGTGEKEYRRRAASPTPVFTHAPAWKKQASQMLHRVHIDENSDVTVRRQTSPVGRRGTAQKEYQGRRRENAAACRHQSSPARLHAPHPQSPLACAVCFSGARCSLRASSTVSRAVRGSGREPSAARPIGRGPNTVRFSTAVSRALRASCTMRRALRFNGAARFDRRACASPAVRRALCASTAGGASAVCFVDREPSAARLNSREPSAARFSGREPSAARLGSRVRRALRACEPRARFRVLIVNGRRLSSSGRECRPRRAGRCIPA